MTARLIYHLCRRDDWMAGVRRGAYGGPAGSRDDFIHFSTAAQVEETAELYFAGCEDLVLVTVEAAALDPALRWEESRDGHLFPHLYGDLPLTAVVEVRDLALDRHGRHLFPVLPP